jgi:hypothetical protein
MMSVDRLDYGKMPPGYRAGPAPGPEDDWDDGDGDGMRTVAWEHYKRRHDPPGFVVKGTSLRTNPSGEHLWRVENIFAINAPSDLFYKFSEARSAAWTWYDRRLALISVVAEMFGRMLVDDAFAQVLVWSDEVVAAWERAVKAVPPCA